jgi:hypothetical protein
VLFLLTALKNLRSALHVPASTHAPFVFNSPSAHSVVTAAAADVAPYSAEAVAVSAANIFMIKKLIITKLLSFMYI